jgi:hypothetical protein
MCLRTLDIFKSFVIHIKSYVVFLNLNPEDGGSIFIRNIGVYLKVYKPLVPQKTITKIFTAVRSAFIRHISYNIIIILSVCSRNCWPSCPYSAPQRLSFVLCLPCN